MTPVAEATGNGMVEIVGAGPVPRGILRTLTPDTGSTGMILDWAGRIVWLGRYVGLSGNMKICGYRQGMSAGLTTDGILVSPIR